MAKKLNKTQLRDIRLKISLKIVDLWNMKKGSKEHKELKAEIDTLESKLHAQGEYLSDFPVIKSVPVGAEVPAEIPQEIKSVKESSAKDQLSGASKKDIALQFLHDHFKGKKESDIKIPALHKTYLTWGKKQGLETGQEAFFRRMVYEYQGK